MQNLTIIIHTFTPAFDWSFEKSNVRMSQLNAKALNISRLHLNAHSNIQHSNEFVKNRAPRRVGRKSKFLPSSCLCTSTGGSMQRGSVAGQRLLSNPSPAARSRPD